jgi:hypothetical protein
MNNVAVVDTSAEKLSISREVLLFRVAKFLEASSSTCCNALLLSHTLPTTFFLYLSARQS